MLQSFRDPVGAGALASIPGLQKIVNLVDGTTIPNRLFAAPCRSRHNFSALDRRRHCSAGRCRRCRLEEAMWHHLIEAQPV